MDPRLKRLLKRSYLKIAPPEAQTILEWAERNRRLAGGVSAIEGPFKALPYQAPLLDAVSSGKYSEHAWMIASQLCKTEAINCVVGYHVDVEPCGIFVVYPTLESAKAYSKKKLAPEIRHNRVLRAKFREARTRDSGNTVLSKEFAGGDIVLAGTNSPASLRATSRRVVIQDEIDSYKESSGDEGDPCALADTRAKNYPNAVKIKASTPTIKGASRIDALFQDSTQSRWHVPCPHCKAPQWLKWDQVEWEEGEPETARYKCEGIDSEGKACGKLWTDTERIRAIYKGKMVDGQPGHSRYGVHVSGLYRLIGLQQTFVSFLHQFVVEKLEADRKGLMEQRVWQNTFLAEPHEEANEAPPFDALMKRREQYLDEDKPLDLGVPAPPSTIPLLPNGTGALVLVAGVDVQGDRLECEIVAYGAGEETYGVQYTVLPGDPNLSAVWEDLDTLLGRTWSHPLGYTLTPVACAIDTGHLPEEVYKYSKRSRHKILCVKGSTGGYGEPILSRPRKSGVKVVPLYMVGTVTAKDWLYSRLRISEAGPGFLHFPLNERRGYDEEWFKSLTAERPTFTWKSNRKVMTFEKIRARNEALDIRCYAHCAYTYINPDFDRLEGKVEKLREQMSDEAEAGSDQTESALDAMGLERAEVPKAQETPPPNTYRKAGQEVVRKIRRGPRKNFATNW